MTDLKLNDFTFEIDADGIAIITWDRADKSMNVMSEAGFEDLIAFIHEIKTNPKILGAIITSGKDSFCAGADINMFEQIMHDGPNVAEQMELASKFSYTLRDLETCGKPIVCAMTGTALGGGFEIALASHYRIAAENVSAKYGLPEVRIGILPGGGGTQRLPRLIGAQEALQMMLLGRLINAKAALKLGILHEIVPADELVATAKKRIFERKVLPAPWDQKGFRIPGGQVYSKGGMQVFPPANALYRKSTYDNYPGARNIMKCVYEGLMVDIDTGLRIEARYFTQLLRTVEAKHMSRSIFVSMQELNKGLRRPKGIEKTKICKVAVIGAGLMGAGIAFVSAKAGIDVVLIDRNMEAAEKGKTYSDKILSKLVKRGRMKGDAKDAIMNRISPADNYDGLKDIDLVIEAVFEDPKIKAEVVKQCEAIMPKGTIFGSNTSTLPITGLAKSSANPENFVGIHFFSPVDKMMLVEIIKGDKTGDAAIAKALDYVAAIKKTPIVVNDSRGFYTSRVVVTYITEALHMMEEGIPPIMIENAGRAAGMPVGPLVLADEIGLDVSYKIAAANKAAMGDAYVEGPIDRLLEELVVKAKRYGRKNGKGLFDYPENGKKHIWPDLVKLQAKHVDPADVDMDELGQRFLSIQALETARCFEENVLTDVREADVGGILGFGFAPFTGGPLSYIDMVGSAEFVKRINGFSQKFGKRFAPTKQLKQMAADNVGFYN
ncbi:MAG: enoyl-CoA hydratase/isomerase family protein [Rhizobiales bacterium]|nr:3-hydroxyacyl-CoA dehydrogenase NAD-binding domain-containing protein [Hyphomicrobiales bacterium]NRB14406.1 enoyl-CoA hydratase/isomerase family protein [Hyphomicrobiales bacterium]